jgi:ankyrin repeat protein
MCRLLLDNRANVKLRDEECWTALHHAVNSSHNPTNLRLLHSFQFLSGRYFDVATLLVKRGSDLAAEDHRHGRTALHLCAEKGFPELVDMLIIRGASMYASGKASHHIYSLRPFADTLRVGDALYSMTPLHLACLHGHTECAKILVQRGADMSTLSGFLDKSPLHLACEYGHYHCVKILLDNGADAEQMGNRVAALPFLSLLISF